MSATRSFWQSAPAVLICGSAVLFIALGIRHGFGVFQVPISASKGWDREVFSFAIAAQNLIWGLAQPVTGMLGDRYGAGKTVFAGALCYLAGLVLMATAESTAAFTFGTSVLIGIGLSGTSFSTIFSAVSRVMPPEQRAYALGLVGAGGSLGQFILLPGMHLAIDSFGWAVALFTLAAVVALCLPLAAPLSETNRPASVAAEMNWRDALDAALRHRGFWLLSMGFFVCGFQVVFIGMHLPAYLTDAGLPASLGAIVLALVGLFNIAGSYLAGTLGSRWRKGWLLCAIYAGRAVAIGLFLLLPLSPITACAFGVAMGFLWLSTVPLTNAIVAGIFGVRNMAMLGGIVFLCHQIGAFLGGWLGGIAYDHTGSYSAVWLIAIGLSVVAALLNIPIRELPVRISPKPIAV